MQTPTTVPVPPISVVVVTLGGRSYVPRCLEALTRQVGVQGVEIVLPCDARMPDVAALQKQFPAVRFLCVAGHRTYAELRALGVQQARGAIIALTEDHCIPEPHWCTRILEAHASPHGAVGGVVEKMAPDTTLNWAVYLCDFSRYMSPVPEGPAGHLTDCNVSYKRTALEAVAHTWADAFHETSVHWTLQERGESLWLSPRIVVYQQRNLRFVAALRERYAFGRLFASTRVAAVSTPRRLLYAAGACLLPVYLAARVGLHVCRKGRARWMFCRAQPLLLILDTVWAFGEFVEYCSGRVAAAPAPISAAS